jgi:GMP synthase-like glutamine amidotransferase
MKPIAIFRHAPAKVRAILPAFSTAHSRPWTLIAIDAGARCRPADEGYAGLVFMGGPMSVNDDLPWIEPTLNLIRQAVAADIPVLGHCLGGQLIAKALGGSHRPQPGQGNRLGRSAVANRHAGGPRLVWRHHFFPGLPLAWRNLQSAARRGTHSVQRALPNQAFSSAETGIWPCSAMSK